MRLFFAALLLLCGAAFAQTPPAPAASAPYRECLPFSQWGAPAGGQLMQGRDNSLKGDWYALWCPAATPGANGQPVWYLMRYAALDAARPPGTKEAIDAALKLWQASTAAESFKASSDMLGALWNAPNTLQLTRAIMSAALSSDPVASLRALVVVPAPPSGTQAYDDVQQLRHQACKQGSVLPPWPPASGVTYPLPAASAVIQCTAPVATYTPPPPTTTVYVVSQARAYPVLANGARGTTALAVSPAVGDLCYCDEKRIPGVLGALYCAVHLPGITQQVVAACKVKP